MPDQQSQGEKSRFLSSTKNFLRSLKKQGSSHGLGPARATTSHNQSSGSFIGDGLTHTNEADNNTMNLNGHDARQVAEEINSTIARLSPDHGYGVAEHSIREQVAIHPYNIPSRDSGVIAPPPSPVGHCQSHCRFEPACDCPPDAKSSLFEEYIEAADEEARSQMVKRSQSLEDFLAADLEEQLKLDHPYPVGTVHIQNRPIFAADAATIVEHEPGLRRERELVCGRHMPQLDGPGDSDSGHPSYSGTGESSDAQQWRDMQEPRAAGEEHATMHHGSTTQVVDCDEANPGNDRSSDLDEDEFEAGSGEEDIGLRHLREDRAVRWEVMVAAGIIDPNDPCKEGFLAGDIDMSNNAYRACKTGAAADSATPFPKKMKIIHDLIGDSDGEGDHEPYRRPAKRTLRVVNGSVSSSSEDSRGKGKTKAKAKKDDGKAQAQSKTSAGASRAVTASNAHVASWLGGTLAASTDRLDSTAMAENVNPMGHWQTETRRVGMPLTSYPTNPIADYQYQDHQMDAINTRLQQTTLSREGSASQEERPASNDSGGKPKRRRSSAKAFLRQAFSRSNKKEGNYIDRLMARGKSAEGKIEGADGVEETTKGNEVDFTCNVKPIKTPGEENEVHPHPLRSNPVLWPNSSEPMFARRPSESTHSGTQSGDQIQQASPPRNKNMTFRGQVESYK